MKRLFIIVAVLGLAGCTHPDEPFVQGEVRIVPPVQIDTVVARCNDGGTKILKMTDGVGNKYDIYIDYRLFRTQEWGTVYLNGYPGTTNAVRITDQKGFRTRFLKIEP